MNLHLSIRTAVWPAIVHPILKVDHRKPETATVISFLNFCLLRAAQTEGASLSCSRSGKPIIIQYCEIWSKASRHHYMTKFEFEFSNSTTFELVTFFADSKFDECFRRLVVERLFWCRKLISS